MKKIFLLLLISFALPLGVFAQFTATLAGPTLVTTGWNIGGYATVIDSFVQLTTAGSNENGYVYFDTITNLTSCAQFDVKFDYQITDAGGLGVADGIAFFYIANPPSGFITGGGLGIPNPITGMIFTLDTWDNDGDALNPESELFGYTAPSTYDESNRTQLVTGIRGGETFMDDGSWHHCEITYNAGVINVYFDYSLTPGMTGFYLITIPGGYFGFSSSTGGGYSIQNVKSIYITANGISPAPTITSPVVYCQNAVADTLIAGGTGPFHWYTTDTATVVSLPGSPTPNTSVVGSKTYFVRQGSGSCISVPDSIEVIVKPQPSAPVISGTTVYCQDTAFIPFTITGATGSVLWYTVDTLGVGSATAGVVNTTVPGTTKWWATQTVAGCESKRDSITVVVHATPTAPIVTGATVYCQYFPYAAPVAIASGVGTNVLWYGTPTGGLGTPVAPTVNTAVPGAYNYYLTQSDSGCTSPREPFTIVVNPQPAPPVVVDVPDNYCPGQPFVPFTIVSGSGVLWYSAATGGSGSGISPGINTTIPGNYTVWATQTVLGCESVRVPYSVTVDDNVAAGFGLLVKNGCKADTVEFYNTSTGATDYSWTFGDISPVSLAQNPTHVYLLQGDYTVTLYASSANCIDSFHKDVSLIHPLSAQFSVDTNLVCQGSSITFTDASVASSPGYLWNFGDGSATSALPNPPPHKYPHTGVYKVMEIVTDYIPCHDTAYATISVDSTSPIYMAITDTVLCTGTAVTFTGNYSSIGNTTITWNFGNGDSIVNMNPVSFAYLAPGTYTVTATADYRVCADTSVSRVINIMKQPELNLGADTSLCKGGDPITITDKLNATSDNAAWLWNTGARTPAITVNEPGKYSVTVKIDGCSASAAINVGSDCYMDIPNAFTPNGDGVNDYFYPRQELTAGLITFNMQIYNRWGQQIFATVSLDGRGWDGRFNNVDQPEGVYVYMIDGTFKDGQKEHHQGNVTLLR